MPWDALKEPCEPVMTKSEKMKEVEPGPPDKKKKTIRENGFSDNGKSTQKVVRNEPPLPTKTNANRQEKDVIFHEIGGILGGKGC